MHRKCCDKVNAIRICQFQENNVPLDYGLCVLIQRHYFQSSFLSSFLLHRVIPILLIFICHTFRFYFRPKLIVICVTWLHRKQWLVLSNIFSILQEQGWNKSRLWHFESPDWKMSFKCNIKRKNVAPFKFGEDISFICFM